VEKVKAGLLELSRHGILEYEPQKDKPQLVFLRDRARAEAVSVNQQQYESRKANFIKRVREMSRFVVEEEKCRSQWIGRYFGDVQIGECGICDNCLRRKPSPLTQEEFDRIHHTILTSLKARPLQTRELIRELVPVSKEKAWKVIEFLQAENKIVIDKNGRVNLAAG
jgi:ATP-dependent DNA helicase RecQ